MSARMPATVRKTFKQRSSHPWAAAVRSKSLLAEHELKTKVSTTSPEGERWGTLTQTGAAKDGRTTYLKPESICTWLTSLWDETTCKLKLDPR